MKLNLRRDGNRKAMSPPLEWEIDVIQQKRFDLFSRKAYNRKGFIHLHILVSKFHLTWRNRDREASASALCGFEWEMDGIWRKRYDF